MCCLESGIEVFFVSAFINEIAPIVVHGFVKSRGENTYLENIETTYTISTSEFEEDNKKLLELAGKESPVALFPSLKIDRDSKATVMWFKVSGDEKGTQTNTFFSTWVGGLLLLHAHSMAIALRIANTASADLRKKIAEIKKMRQEPPTERTS